MQALLHNTLYLGLAVLALGLLIALFVSDWVARPLVALNHWAAQLAAGQWQASPPQRSPVREVSDLARSLDQMARQLQQNTEQLEQRVAQRTAELQQANLQLAELSRTDALTGLGNRRHFDEILADEWARAARSGQQLALLMLDVDHFKLYNDHLGHQAGDQCLKTIASVLQSCARRAGDHVARYGGEEFAVIAADCDLARARQLGETILSVLATLGLPHPHSPLGRVSLSIGVAVRAASNQGSAGELIEQADAALYRAKQNGRNRVESDA
jgi:diguanylate cyclase (GGDEF)-like protein